MSEMKSAMERKEEEEKEEEKTGIPIVAACMTCTLPSVTLTTLISEA